MFRQYEVQDKVMENICDRILQHEFDDDEKQVVLAHGNATVASKSRFPGR